MKSLYPRTEQPHQFHDTSLATNVLMFVVFNVLVSVRTVRHSSQTVICYLLNILRHFKLIVFWLANFMIDFYATRSFSSISHEIVIYKVITSYYAILYTLVFNGVKVNRFGIQQLNIGISFSFTCFDDVQMVVLVRCLFSWSKTPNWSFKIPFVVPSFLQIIVITVTVAAASKVSPWHLTRAPFRCTRLVQICTQQNCILIMLDPSINFRDKRHSANSSTMPYYYVIFTESRTLNMFDWLFILNNCNVLPSLSVHFFLH